MKTVLKAGATLDVLSPSEYAQGVAEIVKNVKPQPPDVIVWSCVLVANSASVLVNAAGNGPSSVIRVNPGQRAEVNRIVVWSPAYTPAAPLEAGWLGLFKNDLSTPPQAFFPDSPSAWTCPNIYAEGHGAFWLKEGERLLVGGGGIAPGTEIQVAVHYRLWDEPGRRVATAGRH